MSRSTRIEFDGACYHVMSRGVARRTTFLDDEDRRSFLEIVGGLVEVGALEVFAFCLTRVSPFSRGPFGGGGILIHRRRSPDPVATWQLEPGHRNSS